MSWVLSFILRCWGGVAVSKDTVDIGFGGGARTKIWSRADLTPICTYKQMGVACDGVVDWMVCNIQT